MCDGPDLSTLPQRMWYAAEILREADVRYGSVHPWSPGGLEIQAQKWESEDGEAAEREGRIEELAWKIFEAFGGFRSNSCGVSSVYWGAARDLVDAGWRKD